MSTTGISPKDATGALREPPADADPFELLGVERRAVIDADALRDAWLRLSREVHPDRFQSAGGEALERARNWSALFNRAYVTLKEPRARLIALMRAGGLATDAGKDAARSEKIPQDLLMDVFEAQEAIEEAAQGTLTVATRDALEGFRGDFEQRLAAYDGELARLAAQWDAAPQRHGELAREINGVLSRRRYIERLLRNAESALNRR